MVPAISCSNLFKNYGPNKVLKGVDLEVPSGKIFALLGTNGAGKTTLIRSLLGLIPTSGGDIKVLGEEPYQIGPKLRQRIGYVSEEQGLYGWMTVAGLINFCKALYERWDDSLIHKYLDRFQLNPKSKVQTLSKGQTVKLALILALAPQPDLLILDEPMNGLDPLAQYEFLQIILKDYNLEGRTVFFSTHILADVQSTAHQAAILHNGKIQTVGNVAEIRKNIAKVKVNNDTDLSSSAGVRLNQNPAENYYLVPQETLSQVAAASEEVISEVTLEEAFFYYCMKSDRHD
ncbi:MAG: ABC transporter ATP-binding protein [Firmicutes bacterium]|nr:ABC transporter ATP-binding protein [Bacillota bacterium]